MLKDKIKNLIKLIENTEIDEIEVSSFWGAQKVRLSKNSKVNPGNVVFSNPKTDQVIVDPIITEKESKISDSKKDDEIKKDDQKVEDQIPIVENLIEVKAPLVGTFYSSPKPDSPSFVNVGDKINKGDTICIIEAMKIFNEIESDASGIVSEICVENGNPVEFDQVIIKVSAD